MFKLKKVKKERNFTIKILSSDLRGNFYVGVYDNLKCVGNILFEMKKDTYKYYSFPMMGYSKKELLNFTVPIVKDYLKEKEK